MKNGWISSALWEIIRQYESLPDPAETARLYVTPIVTLVADSGPPRA
jgi:hypothetical protein